MSLALTDPNRPPGLGKTERYGRQVYEELLRRLWLREDEGVTIPLPRRLLLASVIVVVCLPLIMLTGLALVVLIPLSWIVPATRPLSARAIRLAHGASYRLLMRLAQ